MAETQESGEVDCGLYDDLATYVASPSFLKAFNLRREGGGSEGGVSGCSACLPCHNVDSPWTLVQPLQHPFCARDWQGRESGLQRADPQVLLPPGQHQNPPSPPGSSSSRADAAAPAAPTAPAATGQGGTCSKREEPSPTSSQSADNYVVVNNEDAVEAMAFYLAQCIAAHPEAQKLAPKQLQDALSTTLQVSFQARSGHVVP